MHHILRGRPRGGIDTTFDLTSVPWHGIATNAIVFSGAGKNNLKSDRKGEGIQKDVRVTVSATRNA